MRLSELILPLAAGLLAAAAGAQSPGTPAAAAGGGVVVRSWVTSADRQRLLARGEDTGFGPVTEREDVLVVDPGTTYQEMLGFGAAITDASAWLLEARMGAAPREALLRELFAREGGIGLSMTRVTIGASDFSLRHYSLDEPPGGGTDPELRDFSIAPMRESVIPALRAAHAINPGLAVIASPWSAPAWMKTSGSLVRGSLREDAFAPFARYLVRFADAMAAEGVPLYALTVQNEPHFEPGNYPGMRLEAPARARLIGTELGPLLRAHQPGVRILEWDHNWDEPESPLAVLSDPVAAPYVSGVAWHCYKGPVEAQGEVHDRFPGKDAFLTECSGGDWRPGWARALPWLSRVVVLGSTRNWARGVILWNLVLDAEHGPHTGGCTDCRAVVTLDTQTGEITRNPEYYALAHLSAWVVPGARRIDSSGEVAGLDHVAFRNPDGTIVLMVVNSYMPERAFAVRVQGREFAAQIPGLSVATFVWDGSFMVP